MWLSKFQFPSRSIFKGVFLGHKLPLLVRLTSTTTNSKSNGSIPTQYTELSPLLVKQAEKYEAELKDLDKDLSCGIHFGVNKQKHYAKLSALTDTFIEYKEKLNELKSLQEMIVSDPSLRAEAEQEYAELVPQYETTSSRLVNKLLPPHPFADKPSLLELRPGVGGIEAMIFTQNLLDMYIGYANYRKWKYRIISKNENESGSGIIDAILSIEEAGSYDRLRFEAGVHRVQRIPSTETKGRTHTSTAAVVVLPQIGDESAKSIDAYERTFKPGEIRVDIMRASGKGGQHVNTTDSAVRLTHIPSGIVVSMQDERSQHKNKAKAFTILRARLAEKERLEKEEKERKARKSQVSSTNRSDKIRTYNFPQNRITDHRCGFTLLDLPGVLSGERLDEVIEAMSKYDSTERAKELLESN
ncbi:Mrf1p [Saccharomyces cerevisiae YJM987]|nr:Mrf1p [Saccharomyces cerevisiae YJM993]AJR87852.1 Mrf1p [Saccharomyces cerevisiae YJM969]AJR88350.1 Mrf1p [Saccharomyces cerevisiae YJM972]AJR88851.1 Mrf1p [Saccharomyces cerevisiae YJM975]AJR89323.1 Mrf1p [Saccharomyces cerevisiae YJM978]AJR90324.1 Mrf1p [Saccharomyces cerevisiae YJM984]AJR90810.1 Mrf1p [Saccharomyces cerevisiae YJM987]AJR91807.1 Mrf1p [Saccharomyces cerevisiae YJM996]